MAKVCGEDLTVASSWVWINEARRSARKCRILFTEKPEEKPDISRCIDEAQLRVRQLAVCNDHLETPISDVIGS